ncbi:ribonuclease H-like domain-containing protein [Tanacetum coccineum]
MDPNSSLGKTCLGKNVVEISSDKVEGSGDWNSPEFQDTANSGQMKETKAMVFYQMDTEEVSDRFVAPCFVNGLEAYDGEINLGVEENMSSNEYAVKLCLEHEVKKGNKVVNKELIVALRVEIYFVKFIINPEDDVEPGVILGRSFLRMTKAITDFGAGTVTIYPEIDPFLEDIEEEEKSLDDWDHLLDFNLDDVSLLGEEELLPFVCKMGKSSRNKKRAMENLNFFYQDIGISSSADKVELDGKIVKEEEEAVKRIKGEALKEKDDPGAFIFPIRLEGHVNENALADTGSDINTMPYRIYEQLGREEMKKVDRGITMINHTQAEAMGILTNVLCRVGVTTLIAKFLILDIPIDRDAPIMVGRGFLRTIGGIVNTPERLFSTFDGFCHQTFRAARSDVMRNAESDSDDEEEYQIKRNKFGVPIYGPKPAPYLNCNDPAERSLAIQTVTNPFRKISVWKKAVSLLGSLPVPLKHVNWKPDYKGCYTKEEEVTRQWRTDIRLTDPYGNIYLQGFTTKKTDQKLSKYHKLSDIMSPNWFTMGTHDDEAGSSRSKRSRQNKIMEEVLLPQAHHEFLLWEGCNRDAKSRMGCDGEIDDMLRIRLREAGSDEELFTSVAWIRAFNINEPIYAKLCHEFYSTYEFDEVCDDDELQTKKIIKFRLGGRAHRGLRSDEHFNAQEYWLSISREENLSLSRRHTSTIKSLNLRVIHKMITYGLCQRTTGHQNGYANVAWLITRWIKRKGVGTQKESQICYGQFISKIARKCRVLTKDVVRSLSAPIYCRDLDTTKLRDLIDSESKLIPEDPQPGVPRVGIPRPPRASMQDLYDRMGRIEIRQEAIERMEYRQSYH